MFLLINPRINNFTCILHLTLFKFILHVKNEAPIVGDTSFEQTFEIYFDTILVLPTPAIKKIIKNSLNQVKKIYLFKKPRIKHKVHKFA